MKKPIAPAEREVLAQFVLQTIARLRMESRDVERFDPLVRYSLRGRFRILLLESILATLEQPAPGAGEP